MDEEFYYGVVKVDIFGFQSMSVVKEKVIKKKKNKLLHTCEWIGA